ncbi:S9 family peptidase [Anthocerotibacter panamensis]|uniref:S9 family peptidase n=1 Tax=Anthocerotibacter panamensis TaxID=2857077 RepID=UPI001C407181|nr:S9 family peptidase [Anthocerotibacter panamensis]
MSQAPYGSWKSPITADLIVTQAIGLGEVALDGPTLYWSELRPTEGGRNVLVQHDGQTTDLLLPPYNVRTRVHEYGGGSFLAVAGTIYFVNFTDQRLYRLGAGQEPEPLTPSQAMRYADAVWDAPRARLLCVREDHTIAGPEPVNTLVALDLQSENEGIVLVSGSDFYSSPRVSPDGTRLCWLAWNHPDMPWDGAQLWTGVFQADGALGEIVRVTGGVGESAFQPEWSPSGVLHFVSDRSGWWNLYRHVAGVVEPICPMAAEFGRPQWVFGLSTYGFAAADRIICSYTQAGVWTLASLDTQTGVLTPIATPYTDFSALKVDAQRAAFLAASPTTTTVLVQYDLTSGALEILRSASSVTLDPAYLSLPQPLEFPTTQQRTAYAFYYPPYNRDYTPLSDERPPLLVLSHGGPTSATQGTLNLKIQFWTSRGFAVVDVNYGGSTGYGRAYRERLAGQWGVVDVDDCLHAAQYLVEQGWADPKRAAIRGGSAGGYTTLSALTFRDFFRAGASYYGVSDLEALAQDTHKFESRYLDRLIGPYPASKERYRARSPVHFCAALNCPVIFFQGLEDKVVPPNQAEVMVAALSAKGVPVAYVPFAAEQHGFRQASNIKRSLEAELYFYSQVFHFPLTEPVEPVLIMNL